VWIGNPRLTAFNRRTILQGAAVAGALRLCPCCKVRAVRAEEWAYGSPAGVSRWGSTCASGAAQSPIDIPLASLAPGGGARRGVGDFVFEYQNLDGAAVLNTGHGTMQAC
jgi:carbonic anhydrase